MRGSWFKWAHKVKKEGRWRGVGIWGGGGELFKYIEDYLLEEPRPSR